MTDIVTARAITGIWESLTKPEPGPAEKVVLDIYRDAVATGWASYVRVESLLLATDPRPLGFGGFMVRELLETFGIPLQWTYRRPRLGDQGGYGIEQVSAVDLAHMLIRMEATGFVIDPAPLCEMLRPQLRAKPYMTGPEIAVWWHAKERHRSAPQTFAVSKTMAGARPVETTQTPGGYRADLWRNQNGQTTAVTIAAPKWRPRRAAA